jgi:hypothetical protein
MGYKNVFELHWQQKSKNLSTTSESNIYRYFYAAAFQQNFHASPLLTDRNINFAKTLH